MFESGMYEENEVARKQVNMNSICVNFIIFTTTTTTTAAAAALSWYY
jgi:hypothetical protein